MTTLHREFCQTYQNGKFAGMLQVPAFQTSGAMQTEILRRLFSDRT